MKLQFKMSNRGEYEDYAPFADKYENDLCDL